MKPALVILDKFVLEQRRSAAVNDRFLQDHAPLLAKAKTACDVVIAQIRQQLLDISHASPEAALDLPPDIELPIPPLENPAENIAVLDAAMSGISKLIAIHKSGSTAQEQLQQMLSLDPKANVMATFMTNRSTTELLQRWIELRKKLDDIPADTGALDEPWLVNDPITWLQDTWASLRAWKTGTEAPSAKRAHARESLLECSKALHELMNEIYKRPPVTHVVREGKLYEQALGILNRTAEAITALQKYLTNPGAIEGPELEARVRAMEDRLAAAVTALEEAEQEVLREQSRVSNGAKTSGNGFAGKGQAISRHAGSKKAAALEQKLHEAEKVKSSARRRVSAVRAERDSLRKEEKEFDPKQPNPERVREMTRSVRWRAAELGLIDPNKGLAETIRNGLAKHLGPVDEALAREQLPALQQILLDVVIGSESAQMTLAIQSHTDGKGNPAAMRDIFQLKLPEVEQELDAFLGKQGGALLAYLESLPYDILMRVMQLLVEQAKTIPLPPLPEKQEGTMTFRLHKPDEQRRGDLLLFLKRTFERIRIEDKP